MTDMIKLSNVHKSFGPKHVLKGVDLSVEKGSSLVVIGGSGRICVTTVGCANNRTALYDTV